MIDLIKKLKRPDTHVSFDEGYNKAIDNVIQLFNQHNIITAPKSIKLSEIVERLTNEFKGYFFEYDNNFISSNEPIIAVWSANKKYCYAVISIENNELVLRDQEDFEYPKWLYTLWIAGTEIIDDLKEK